MSGEVTITPGYELDNEPVTLEKLNLMARPVARVAEASIGSRELNISELTSAVGNSLNNLNFLVGGNFDETTWTSGAGPFTATAGAKTYGNYTFWLRPTGGAVTINRVTSVPTANNTSLFAMRLDGAAGVTTVDIGQELRRSIAAGLRNTITFSAWIYNATLADLVPVLLLNTADVADNFTSVTNRASVSLQTCANGAWTKVTATLDATNFSNMTNGLQVILQLPDGSLNSSGKSLVAGQIKLEIGSVPTPLNPRPGEVLAAGDVQSIHIQDLAVTQSKMADDAVSNAKLVNMANGTVKGRKTAGSGDPEDITFVQLMDLLDLAPVDLASSSLVAVGAAASKYVRMTGTTTITAFDTVTAGVQRLVRFAGALTLTHNATSFIMPGGLDILTAANDAALFVSEGGGNWRCLAFWGMGGLNLNNFTTDTAVDADADYIPVYRAGVGNRKVLVQTAVSSQQDLGTVSSNQAVDVGGRALSHSVWVTLTGNMAITLSNGLEQQVVLFLVTASGGSRTVSFADNINYKIQDSAFAAATGIAVPSGETWLFACAQINSKWYINVGKSYA